MIFHCVHVAVLILQSVDILGPKIVFETSCHLGYASPVLSVCSRPETCNPCHICRRCKYGGASVWSLAVPELWRWYLSERCCPFLVLVQSFPQLALVYSLSTPWLLVEMLASEHGSSYGELELALCQYLPAALIVHQWTVTSIAAGDPVEARMIWCSKQ